MKITLNHNSPIPLHIQIEEQLRVAIKSEEYQKGVKLPNEMDLSKQLGISRSTLRHSINKLVYEGLLIRKKGVGTFVKKTSVSSKAQNWLSFSQEMKALGITTKNYELHLSWVKPNEELCLFFDIKNDVRILKLERVRGKAEYPFVYFISYFNPRIGLTGNEDCGQMSAWYIMSSLGLYTIAPGQQQYQVGLPQFAKAVVHLENGKKLTILNSGAVVSRDIPAYGVAVGNPAKVVKFRQGPFVYNPVVFSAPYEAWIN